MEIPRHWRLKKQRYGLVGNVCRQGHVNFPPTEVCHHKADEEPFIPTNLTNNEVEVYDAHKLPPIFSDAVSRSSR